MIGKNGRSSWERQGITAFCTCQWNDLMLFCLHAFQLNVRHASYNNETPFFPLFCVLLCVNVDMGLFFFTKTIGRIFLWCMYFSRVLQMDPFCQTGTFLCCNDRLYSSCLTQLGNRIKLQCMPVVTQSVFLYAREDDKRHCNILRTKSDFAYSRVIRSNDKL